MENKIKKRSINSVIYLLLAAMLVGVIGVSVYTVDSRRKPTNPDVTSDDSTSLDSDTSTNAPDTTENAPKDSGVTDDKAESKTDSDSDTQKQTEASSSTKTDVPASVNVHYFVEPASGFVSKTHELDIPVYSLTMNDYRAHAGIDIQAPLGSDVVSASSGKVCRILNDPLMGKTVTIDHGDGIYSTYKNLAEELALGIEVGASVSMGQVIGSIGESAIIEIAENPHLHFELEVNGEHVDPLEYVTVAKSSDDEFES